MTAGTAAAAAVAAAASAAPGFPETTDTLKEVDFFKNPTVLSRLILNQKYDGAIQRLKSHPNEASVWVCSKRNPFQGSAMNLLQAKLDSDDRSVMSTLSEAVSVGSCRSVLSNSSASARVSRRLRGINAQTLEFSLRQLPIHTACSNLVKTSEYDEQLRQGLERLIAHLVSKFPEGCAYRDHEGRLPLHEALWHNVSPTTVSMLLIAYPDGIHQRDKFGRAPLDLNRYRSGENKAAVKAMLMRGVPFWMQARDHAFHCMHEHRIKANVNGGNYQAADENDEEDAANGNGGKEDDRQANEKDREPNDDDDGGDGGDVEENDTPESSCTEATESTTRRHRRAPSTTSTERAKASTSSQSSSKSRSRKDGKSRRSSERRGSSSSRKTSSRKKGKNKVVEPVTWVKLERRAVVMEQLLNEVYEKNFELNETMEELVKEKNSLWEQVNMFRSGGLTLTTSGEASCEQSHSFLVQENEKLREENERLKQALIAAGSSVSASESAPPLQKPVQPAPSPRDHAHSQAEPTDTDDKLAWTVLEERTQLLQKQLNDIVGTNQDYQIKVSRLEMAVDSLKRHKDRLISSGASDGTANQNIDTEDPILADYDTLLETLRRDSHHATERFLASKVIDLENLILEVATAADADLQTVRAENNRLAQENEFLQITMDRDPDRSPAKPLQRPPKQPTSKAFTSGANSDPSKPTGAIGSEYGFESDDLSVIFREAAMMHVPLESSPKPCGHGGVSSPVGEAKATPRQGNLRHSSSLGLPETGGMGEDESAFADRVHSSMVEMHHLRELQHPAAHSNEMHPSTFQFPEPAPSPTETHANSHKTPFAPYQFPPSPADARTTLKAPFAPFDPSLPAKPSADTQMTPRSQSSPLSRRPSLTRETKEIGDETPKQARNKQTKLQEESLSKRPGHDRKSRKTKEKTPPSPRKQPPPSMEVTAPRPLDLRKLSSITFVGMPESSVASVGKHSSEDSFHSPFSVPNFDPFTMSPGVSKKRSVPQPRSTPSSPSKHRACRSYDDINQICGQAGRFYADKTPIDLDTVLQSLSSDESKHGSHGSVSRSQRSYQEEDSMEEHNGRSPSIRQATDEEPEGTPTSPGDEEQPPSSNRRLSDFISSRKKPALPTRLPSIQEGRGMFDGTTAGENPSPLDAYGRLCEAADFYSKRQFGMEEAVSVSTVHSNSTGFISDDMDSSIYHEAARLYFEGAEVLLNRPPRDVESH